MTKSGEKAFNRQGNKPQKQAEKGSCRSSVFYYTLKKDIWSHLEDTLAKEVVLLLITQCWAQCCTVVGSAARIQQNSVAIRLPGSFCQEPRLWAAQLPLEGWFLQFSQPSLNVRIPSQLFRPHQLMPWKQQVFSGWSCLHWLIFFFFFPERIKRLLPIYYLLHFYPQDE